MLQSVENDKHSTSLRLYPDPGQRQRHLRQMQVIAEELQRPVVEIMPLYEGILETLIADAKVTEFLPVLVAKKLRAYCRPLIQS